MLCINQTTNLGIFKGVHNLPNFVIYFTNFGVKVKRCQNSTENNNSCSTEEEFNEVAKSIIFETNILTIDYSEDPYIPRKRAYKFEIYTLDLKERKNIEIQLSKHIFSLNDEETEIDYVQEETAKEDTYNIPEEKDTNQIFIENQFSMGFIP